MDNRNNENEMDMIDGETTMPRMDVGFEPEHLDELPDMENVEDFVGGDRVYDEETAGALAALMFAKNHPEESASKVAGDVSCEVAEPAKGRMSPLVVIVIASVILLELACGFLRHFPLVDQYKSIYYPRSNSENGSFALVPEVLPVPEGGSSIISSVVKDKITGDVEMNNGLGIVSPDGSVVSGVIVTSPSTGAGVASGGSEGGSAVVTSPSSGAAIDYSEKVQFENIDTVGSTDSGNSISAELKGTTESIYTIEFSQVETTVVTATNTSTAMVLVTPVEMFISPRYNYSGNLPEFGDAATIRLVCLCELFALGRLRKRDSDAGDETEGCEDLASGDDPDVII